MGEKYLPLVWSDVHVHTVSLGEDVETDQRVLVPVVAVVDLVDNLGQLGVVTRSAVNEVELPVWSPSLQNRK